MTPRDRRFAEDEQPQTDAAIPAPQVVQEEADAKPDQVVIKDNHGRLHFFSAFCENPRNVSFDTQEPNEHILLFLRKSVWINFPWMIMTLILVLIPFALFYLRNNFLELLPSLQAVILVTVFYYLLVILYAFINFITWYYNAALITDKRVMDIDFHQLVFKDVAETKLTLVQDVSYNQIGVLENMLGFGHVLIQTAGTLDNFEFYALPKPAKVVEIVEDLIGGRTLNG